jgi:hypothetical protein
MHPQVVAPNVRRESARIPPNRVGLPESLGGGSQLALAAPARSGPSGPGYFASFAKVVHRPKAAFCGRRGRKRIPSRRGEIGGAKARLRVAEAAESA